MATTARRKGSTSSGRRPARSGSQALEHFAEDLGRMLGAAQARASAWLNQRKDVAKQLAEIRDTASGLLSQLQSAAASATRRARRAASGAPRRRKPAAARRATTGSKKR